MGGEGYVMALRAGAELTDMEFVQFFPIGHLAPRLVGLDPITNSPDDRHELLDQPHVQDLVSRFGVPCFLSKVGEANVTDMMLQQRAVFGGEGNGGPIDPRVGYVRDSFVGMALVLDAS